MESVAVYGGLRRMLSFFQTRQLMLVIPSPSASLRTGSVENGASGASDMDGCAARAAARESGDERVKSLDVSLNESFVFRR